jgi:hypothetical protein
MATLRRYSIEFKRQVVQEYQAGETLHGLAERETARSAGSTLTVSAPWSCPRPSAAAAKWSQSWKPTARQPLARARARMSGGGIEL